MIPRVLNEVRGRKILDVGCGCGVYGYILRNKWQDAYPGRDQFRDLLNRDPSNDQPTFLAGVDVQEENARRCRFHRVYDYLALAHADALPFPDGLVDTILCIEVLEHLEPTAARRAIAQFERIATQRIVITVPKLALNAATGADERHFLHLHTDDPEIQSWMEAERHKSSFSIRDLRELGFRVGREIRRGRRRPKDLLLRAWENHGPPSGQILAVKDLHRGPAATVHELPTAKKETEGVPDFR
jgi:SAM-dependent methyltransferase